MSGLQEISPSVPILPLQAISGSIGRTFGITSNGPVGYYTSAGGDVGGSVVRGATGSYAMQNIAAESGPFFVAVTIDNSELPISGTNIPLYRISALLDGGLTVAQVKEDFPSLSVEQIVQARDYARAFPNYGKPYPTQSLKRLLRNSGFGELKRALRKGKKGS
jgi:hypothetical protein